MLRAVRRSGVILSVLLGGLILEEGPSLARDSEGAWEVGAYTTFSTYSGVTEIEAAFPGFGLRGGYHFKAIHELEVDLDRVDSDHKKDSTIQFEIFKTAVNYVRNYLPKGKEKMAPFITFGLGTIKVTREQDPAAPGTDAKVDHSSTMLRLGGGLKYFYTPKVGFRFDSKIYHWRGDDVVVPRKGHYSFDLTLAATFLFGGEK
jgi:outer membrane protein with beta-barrel domain